MRRAPGATEARIEEACDEYEDALSGATRKAMLGSRPWSEVIRAACLQNETWKNPKGTLPKGTARK